VSSDDTVKLRRRRRRALVTAALGTVIVVAAVSFAVTKALSSPANPGDVVTPPASSTVRIGASAPAGFSLSPLGGGAAVRLARLLRGRPGVINFFASWCTACQAELSTFAAAAASYRSAVTFVGIDTNDTDGALALALARRGGVRYPLLSDSSSGQVATIYGINGLPATFFVDRGGHVREEIEGRATAAQLQSALDPMLAHSTS
jgi:cytochrome c biogenesis protein CcmG/thiol:disulfide interchange protein DsbE